MTQILKLMTPVLAGGLAAALTMFGIIYSQTKAPDANPAQQQILVYGDQS